MGEALSQLSPSGWAILGPFVIVPLMIMLVRFVQRYILHGAAAERRATPPSHRRPAEPTWQVITDARERLGDVAGIDEVKEEISEILDMMQTPERYRALGVTMPKGLILHGPPGTGKTLLARAVAGEARATFIAAGGSSFAELFVGVGPRRVRELFAQARQHAPAIVFIDELDAIGRRRTGSSSENGERDATLNQLLVELDGAEPLHRVLVIGATNRLDLLDPALVRPGRFDRHLAVGMPSHRDRVAILLRHTRTRPLDGVDLDALATQTAGMSGADLANLCNEAALLAVRKQRPAITGEDFSLAFDRVLAGPRRRSLVLSSQDRVRVAVHEVGHAVVSYHLAGRRIRKMSILPRNRALGFTLDGGVDAFDRSLATELELRADIAVMLAGRAAEELFSPPCTTGSRDDLRRASAIAEEMVCQYGMSGLGLAWREEPGGEAVRAEVSRILHECREAATACLRDHAAHACGLIRSLLEAETLGEEEVWAVLGSESAAAVGEAAQLDREGCVLLRTGPWRGDCTFWGTGSTGGDTR